MCFSFLNDGLYSVKLQLNKMHWLRDHFHSDSAFIPILESLLILPWIYLGYDLFQLSLCFTLREVAHVVILRRHPATNETSRTANNYPDARRFTWWATPAWRLCRFWCSSWWWGRTRCRGPTRACGRDTCSGGAAPPGCPSRSSSDPSSPGGQPENIDININHPQVYL